MLFLGLFLVPPTSSSAFRFASSATFGAAGFFLNMSVSFDIPFVFTFPSSLTPRLVRALSALRFLSRSAAAAPKPFDVLPELDEEDARPGR